MSIFTKVAVGAALALPMTAYVVGTLVSADSEPVRPDPIVLEYDVTDSVSPAPTSGRPDGAPSDDRDDSAHDGDDPSSDEPEVVRADPDDLDEDDSSGPGSGDDRDDREDSEDDDHDDHGDAGGEERDDDDRDDTGDRGDGDDD